MRDLQVLSGSKRFVGDLKISRNTDRLRDLVFVFVEGDSDQRFFSNFLKGCKIYPRAGWEKLIETMDEAKRADLGGFLGILDADFRKICPDKYNDLPPDTFVTDFHDVEMQLIQSEALEKVLIEYDQGHEFEENKRIAFEKRRNKALRDVLLHEARKIGIVRLLNHQEGWGLSFKQKAAKEPLDFDFVDEDNVEINLEKLLKVLEQKNQRHGHFSGPGKESRALVLAELEKEHDPWQLCNGHDAVRILAIALEKAISNQRNEALNKRVEDLESKLRVAYQPAHFAQTQLYRDLKAWPVPEGYNFEVLP